MDTININLDNKNMGELLEKIAYNIVAKAEDIVRKEVKTHTANLANSFYVKKISNDTVELGNTAKYATHLEYGTVAHMIKPTKGKALHWKEGGKDMFSKGHMVKGIKPVRFMERAIQGSI